MHYYTTTTAAERMQTMTAAWLIEENAGASASRWMQLRIAADEAGRVDLVQVCIEQAEAAYEREDA